MAVLLSTTFDTGSEGDPWPSPWSTGLVGGTTGGAINIDFLSELTGGRGRMRSHDGDYTVARADASGITVDNTVVEGSLRFPVLSEQYISFWVRGGGWDASDPWAKTNGYYFFMRVIGEVGNDTFALGKYVNGVNTWLSTYTPSVQYTTGRDYIFKFDLNGNTIQGKFWDPSLTEPAWLVSATDTDFSSGGIALSLQSGNATDGARQADFDNIVVTSTTELAIQPSNWSSPVRVTTAIDPASPQKQFFRYDAATSSVIPVDMYLGGLLTNLLSPTVSDLDLQVWQSRATSGPYQTAGDVSLNSPGDWDRVLARTATFTADPTFDRSIGPYADGYTADPLDVNASNTHDGTHIYLHCAAFKHLVTNDPTVRDQVKTELLWHFETGAYREGGPDDFANRTRWEFEASYEDGGPAHVTSSWMVRMSLAYSYLLAADEAYGTSTFTTAQKGAIEYVIDAAASYWTEYMDRYLEAIWGATRYDGTYMTSMVASYGKIGYYGSKQTSTIHRRYNNRKATAYLLGAVAGVILGNATLQSRAKLFAKEWLAFSVFPEGWFGEFERWESLGSAQHELGWAYSGILMSTLAGIVHYLALNGDKELLTYGTATGIYGTEASFDKTFQFAVDSYLKYSSDQYTRYGTDSSANLNLDYRIDGRNPRDASVWANPSDVWVSPISMWLGDTDQRAIYMRQHSGTVAYTGQDNGHFISQGGSGWMGAWSSWPGILFMYGQREGQY